MFSSRSISISRRRFAVAMLATPFAGVARAAASFPSHPITLIVASSAGSSTDSVARLTAKQMNQFFNSPVIVENRPGAGNIIGWTTVARAPADGYTLLTTELSYVIAPGVVAHLPFDARRDFAQIVTIASVPHVMAINPSVPAKNVQEFIAYAKANPGKLNFGSGGLGTNPHMCGELFKSLAGVDLVHVPYKGAAAATQDLLTGQIQMLTSSIPTMLPYIKSGKLRALMVTSDKRSPVLPDVPSAVEVGMPKMVATFWVGLAAPAKTPAAVIARLNQAVVESLSKPDFRKRLADMGMDPIGNTPAQATEFVSKEIDRWAAVAKTAHIQIG